MPKNYTLKAETGYLSNDMSGDIPAQPTPEPWELVTSFDSLIDVVAVGMTNQKGLKFLNTLNTVAISKEEALANARLMIAAPKMFSYLEQIQNMAKSPEYRRSFTQNQMVEVWDTIIAMIDDALA